MEVSLEYHWICMGVRGVFLRVHKTAESGKTGKKWQKLEKMVVYDSPHFFLQPILTIFISNPIPTNQSSKMKNGLWVFLLTQISSHYIILEF